MSVEFSAFLHEFVTNIPFAITVILVLASIFVNGWTDAPNAIATCVSTRAMPVKKAIFMAAGFNFLGVLVMTMFSANVASTIFHMVDFGGDAYKALVALCAALVAIVVWSVATWYFGIPTSASHALIAGITGAAIALKGSFSAIEWSEWQKVLYGLGLSTLLGFVVGFIIVKCVAKIFYNADRRVVLPKFRYGQIAAGALLAFMHGAQDGQKFMGVFLLGAFLAQGEAGVTTFEIPFWLMLLCSAVMALGTSVGGQRIIKSVGMDMVSINSWQGFSGDLAAAFILFLATVLGLPVSTTHTKTAAVMGVGAAKRLSSVNWLLVRDMVMTWILTFPGAGAIGWFMVFLFRMILSA